MATVDETVTGSGDILDFNSTADNVSIIVLETGNAIQIDPEANGRWINLGWWAPLARYDIFGDGDHSYAGKARFIEFLESAWRPVDFDVFDFHGLRYHLLPGVEVRFYIP